jgi:membrane-bound lytic murein transglycosylase F
LLLLFLAACQGIDPPEKSGELVIGVREAPAFFQQEESGASGFEHDLAVAFAEYLELKPRLVIAKDPLELKELSVQEKVHLVTGMSIGDGEQRVSSPIRQVGQIIVGQSDGLGPEDLDELKDYTVQVVAGSPLATTLRGLANPPQVVEVPGIDEMGLLESVAANRNRLVAVHEIHLDLAVIFYPELRTQVRLPGVIELGWVFTGPGAPWLQSQANEFIALAKKNGTLARIQDRYFGHIKRITAPGVAQFIEDIGSKLPNFRRDFQAAEELTGIDWRLIAALAYQESKWNPLATSYTNVRGMMMLTEDTADHLGVKNRLDAAESIRAGARYFLELAEQIPASSPYPDRLWLALSAYNMGMGHFRGARSIATGMKRDPDSWYEMKQVLPKLARPEVYARLKSGRARGGEAVIMVENIRTYFDILSRFEAPHTTPFPKPIRSR